MHGPRIAAVRRHDPGMVGDIGVAIHVVPAGVEDHPVVRDAGSPFVRLVKTQAADVAAVGGHVVHGVRRAGPAASQVSAAPLADEGDPPAGHPARLEIVPGPVGQLPQILAVRPHLEEVITPPRVPVAFRAGRCVAGVSVRPGTRHRQRPRSGRHRRAREKERIRPRSLRRRDRCGDVEASGSNSALVRP